MGFFSKYFGKRSIQSGVVELPTTLRATGEALPADPAIPVKMEANEVSFSSSRSADPVNGAVRALQHWRHSEEYQLILLYFTSPTAIGSLPRSYNWQEILGESLELAIRRLITDGGLREVTETKWRILHGRGASELKELCRSSRLRVSGTKEQLAERLTELDPTGCSLGTQETLLICSDEAVHFIALHRHALEAARGDLRELWGLFSWSEFLAEKEMLTRRSAQKGFSRPSGDDVKWSLLNKRVLEHTSERNLGLVRNIYYAMAGFLERRDKWEQALQMFLLVCAYDLNGSSNYGRISTDMLKEFPPFDLRFSSLAPAVVAEMQTIMEKVPLTLIEVSHMFRVTTAKTAFPSPPEQSWSILALALEGKIDLNQQPECFMEIRDRMSNNREHRNQH